MKMNMDLLSNDIPIPGRLSCNNLINLELILPSFEKTYSKVDIIAS